MNHREPGCFWSPWVSGFRFGAAVNEEKNLCKKVAGRLTTLDMREIHP